MTSCPLIAVVYLARKAEGLESFRKFLDSYRSISPGIDHQLIIVYKGFEGDSASLRKAQNIFAKVASQEVLVNDLCVDVGAYLQAAHQINSRYICFLNTHTVVRAPHWLAFLATAITRSEIGLAGATASFESLYDSCAITCKASWLIYFKKIPYSSVLTNHYAFVLKSRLPVRHQMARLWQNLGEKLHVRSKEIASSGSGNSHRDLEEEWIRYWDWCLSPKGPYHYLSAFPRFPNAHIRSNGFIVNRKWLIYHFPSIDPAKHAAYEFESGLSGLSRRVLAEGLSLAVVDRHGKIYLPDEWEKSRTFRLQDQDGLILEDNQTRSFEAMGPQVRNVYIMMSWGRRLVKSTPPPNLGFSFQS